MDEKLIAPCGMNCSLCIAYQFRKNDINKKGFHKKYCPGCIPRGENCTHMSMIENLDYIKEFGMENFLTKEGAKWIIEKLRLKICNQPRSNY